MCVRLCVCKEKGLDLLAVLAETWLHCACATDWCKAARRMLPYPVFMPRFALCVCALPLQAARLAVSRARPPLAACGRVWALRQGPLGRLEAGSWAGQHHMAAVAKERAYWSRVSESEGHRSDTVVSPLGGRGGAGAFSGAAGLHLSMSSSTLLLPQVAVRGYLMVPAPKTASPTAPPVSSCTVPPALGAISCVCASPVRHLLAVGTDKGAVLVWDVSTDTPAGPVFQVLP